MSTPPTFESRLAVIEPMLQKIEQWPDLEVREAAREIVRSLWDLHGEGLKRIVNLLREGSNSPRAVWDGCLEDDLVRSLLLLHDLHPDSLADRVEQALTRVRPYLQSHGRDVELLELTKTGVRLRLSGSCHGCRTSSTAMLDLVQQAIEELAPDAGAIAVENVDAAAPAPKQLVSLHLPAAGPNSLATTRPDSSPPE